MVFKPVGVDENGRFPTRVQTALSATFVPYIPELEAVPFYTFGHSFVYGDGEVVGSRWVDRMQSWLRTLPQVNNAQNGSTSSVIAARVLSSWTPGNRGLVALMLLMNDVQFSGLYGSAPALTQDNMRTILAYLSAGAALSETSANVGFNSDSWASVTGTYVGGKARRTTTIGDFVDIGFNGDEVSILTAFGTSATEGTVQVTASGTQNVIRTVDLGNRLSAVPGVIRLTGFGPGDHSIRLKLTAGSGFTVDSVLIPNPNPPVILVAREGPVQGFLSGPFVNDVATGNTKLTTVFGPALDSVVAEFPNAIVTRNAGPADWDSASMSGADKLHPNAKGSASYAREALRAIGRPGWKEGLNPLTAKFVAPTTIPVYVPGTATVPGKPLDVTAAQEGNGIRINWVAPSNGGSLITDYVVEYKETSGAWTAVAHAASSATTMLTPDLAAGTYTVRVSAKNAVGTGALSATPSVTLIVITTIASDSFTRADSSTIGSTPTGGFAWTGSAVSSYVQPTWSILSNALKAAYTSGTTEGLLYVDTAQANGRIKAKMATAGDFGLAFRIASGTSFWMLWIGGPGSGTYKLMKYTGSYATVVSTSVSAAAGDVLEVTLNGSVITAYVNGVQIATTTDAYNSTATKHGFRAAPASGASFTVDDFVMLSS